MAPKLNIYEGGRKDDLVGPDTLAQETAKAVKRDEELRQLIIRFGCGLEAGPNYCVMVEYPSGDDTFFFVRPLKDDKDNFIAHQIAALFNHSRTKAKVILTEEYLKKHEKNN